MGNSSINCHLMLECKKENYDDFRKYSNDAYVIEIKGSNWVSVYDGNTDGDVENLKSIAQGLTKELCAKALVFDLFDSDVFSYYLIVNGNLIDSYCSNPNYFDNGDAEVNAEKNAKILCDALNMNKALKDVISALGEGGYVFEEERVEKFAEILGIDPIVASSGYGDIFDVEDYLEDKIKVYQVE